jgi:hypothetical protein
VSQDRSILSEHEQIGLVHDDAMSDCIMHVLEILPNVKRGHATTLVTDTIKIYGTGTLGGVLHTLLDDPRYLKVQKRGNPVDSDLNSVEEGSPPEEVNCGLNYGDHNRPFVGGHYYAQLALVHLFISLHSSIHIYAMS